MTEYGRYRIQKELGKGNMGVVYLAHDPQIERPVALKVLRQDRMVSEDFILRFVKEAKAIGRLSHPNIVTVYDVGQDHDTIYIAMEYLEGKPFDEVIRSSRLDSKKIIDIGVQVAETLDYAHKKKIVHRDIKPSNIILTNEGRVKLTDFGIAHIEDQTAIQQTQAGEILGTPVYMSPEQAMGSPIDGRSDLYSLGVILYELIVGRRPFNGGNITAILRAIIQDTPDQPSQIDPFIPESLSDLIMRSISRDPDDRFQTGAEMAMALNAELGIGAKEASTVRKPEQKAKPITIWMAASIVALAVATGGWYLWKTKLWIIAPKNQDRIVAPNVKKENHQTKDKTVSKREKELPELYDGESKAIKSVPDADEKPSKELKIQLHTTLMIDSTPAGARVFIDDMPKGSTPLNLKLPLGEYNVRMSLAEHYEWKADLELSEEGRVPLHVNLVPTE
jgi:serine/threonine-protein kinase